MTPSPAPRGELTPEIPASVIYRKGRLTDADYVEAIEALQDARGQTQPDGANCRVCHDSGHQAMECHHNPLVIARRYAALEGNYDVFRCFHCGEAFIGEAAREHFGKDEEEIARCLSGPPSGQESEEWCPRCDGCGWYEGGKTLQTKCERCGGTGKVSGEAVCSFCKESGHYGFECKKLAATDVWQESRAGGAAPQPDFAEAQKACLSLGDAGWSPQFALLHLMTIRATLDGAEREIARLREENATADKKLLVTLGGHAQELARLRSSPQEETQRVFPEVRPGEDLPRCREGRVVEWMTAQNRGHMPLPDIKPCWIHLDDGSECIASVPSVSPSVPKEEAR